MKEIARAFLANAHTAPWTKDEHTKALIQHVYDCVWDPRARQKYPNIRQKPSHEWSLEDIYAYLSFIAVTDRTNEGCIDRHVADGTISELMKRYLEIVEDAQ